VDSSGLLVKKEEEEEEEETNYGGTDGANCLAPSA